MCEGNIQLLLLLLYIHNQVENLQFDIGDIGHDNLNLRHTE